MGSLAYIPVGERHLAVDVQALANQFVREHRYDDPHLLVLKDRLQHDDARDVTIDSGDRNQSRTWFSCGSYVAVQSHVDTSRTEVTDGTVSVALQHTTSGEYTEVEKKALKNIACAKKILVYSLKPNEYDKISTCDTAKEIWEALQIAYDGTTQVKQDKSNTDNSSTMAVEGDKIRYDSTLALMAHADNDEDNGNEEVNFRDVQKNLKSYSPKKLMCLADVLIIVFCSLADDRDSLFLELEESEITRKGLVAVITYQKNAIETLRKEKSDLLAEAADQREQIVEPLTKSKPEKIERGKEIVSEEYVRLKGEMKALICRMSAEIDKNELLQANLEKGGNVSFGNGKKGYILGVGKVGKSLTHSIENVYYVNGLEYSLLSVSQICDKGNKVEFLSKICTVTDLVTGEVILVAKRYKNIYVADFESLQSGDMSCLKSVDDDVELWHRRLVHGLPMSQFKTQKVCDACTRGKHVKSSFKSKRYVITSKPLELLHMDLCGPMRVQSRGEKRYIFVIVDDYSRFTWTLFLRTKDETVEVFVAFVKKIQVKRSLKLYALDKIIEQNLTMSNLMISAMKMVSLTTSQLLELLSKME
ncbi:uncharacterized protein [Nicotiana sylvestris]|uniref:uncharacterized protein n=1 Tax=Nicotiana sylvestris TaxID=4096 RepID=UPI00388CE516